MRNRLLIALATAAVAVLATMASAARVEDSLAALAAKRDPGNRFSFIVVSDMHSGAAAEDTRALRAAMAEISLLRPELVVGTGDLIQGNELAQLDREWAENLSDAALCRAPFFPVAGNHDVAGPETEAVWAKINGPLHYAFDRGNSHFVVLNTQDPRGVWGDEQIRWLKADLAASRAEHIFVFMHDRGWASEPRRWAKVHELLREYPVRIVFGGHWHTYRKFDAVDGIEYVGVPSIGRRQTEGQTSSPALGAFGGYVLVHVDGDEVAYAAVQEGSIFPPDVSLQSDVDEPRRIAREYVQLPTIDYEFGQRADTAMRVVVKNPYALPLSSAIVWQSPAGWQVTPASHEYEVPAGGDVSLEFRVRAASPAATTYATPSLSTEYRFGPKQEKVVTVHRRLELRPSFPAIGARGPITVNGKLDEWVDVPAMPLGYASRISITETENLSAKAQFQWDGGHFYLAVSVRDNVFYQPYSGDGVWQADCLEMFFDPKGDGNDVDSDADDYSYSMALTAQGPQCWAARTPTWEEGEVWDIELAVDRSGHVTTYEAAIPVARLTPTRLAKGSILGYNLVVQDKDGPDPGRRHWWVELLPGAGSGSRPFPLVRLLLQ